MSQLSMVPKASSPASARARAPGTSPNIQAILLAEKYASGTSPVRDRISATTAGSLASASIMGAVRRHCHTMAFAMGSPVARSHTTVVSRWLVMPMAATSSGLTL